MKNLIYILLGPILAIQSCNQERFNDTQFNYEEKDGSIIVTNQQISYKIEAFRPDIVKTTFLPDLKSVTEENDYFIVLEKERERTLSVEEFNDRLLLKTTELQVEITKSPFVVNYYNHKSEPLLLASKKWPCG